jgi:hypothetical protein
VRRPPSAGGRFRRASRFAESRSGPVPVCGSRISAGRADINDESSVAAAAAGAFIVVNAVSLYVERGRDTFPVHVEAAAGGRRSPSAPEKKDSGIGTDAGSASSYSRSPNRERLCYYWRFRPLP